MGLNRSYRQRLLGRSLLLSLLVGFSLAGGCTKSTGSVAQLSGKVTLDGQPLPVGSFASVSFQPLAIDKGRATSAQIVDSQYECPSVPQGTVLAFIHLSIPTGQTLRDERTGQNISKLENVLLVAEEEEGIEVSVTSDATVDFDLHRAKRQIRAGG
jgi:hypothetical protein